MFPNSIVHFYNYTYYILLHGDGVIYDIDPSLYKTI
jgi:hypothetical protein